MSNEISKIDELIEEQLKTNHSFREIASSLSVSVEKVESVCFQLCKTKPSEFEYGTYLTAEWLKEKLQEHSIFGIANITGLKYRKVQYYLGKHGITLRQRIDTSRPSEDDLRNLFLVEKLTDRQIGDKYGLPFHAIKNMRYKYGIMKSDRDPIDETLTLSFFHRLYVTLEISMVQLASLFGTSRFVLAQIKANLCVIDDPLAVEISRHSHSRKNQKLFDRMLSEIPHSELIEELKTKDLYVIASQHNLLKSSDRGITPFSREWFLLELQTKSPTKIANETGKAYTTISAMIDSYGIDRSKRRDEINPKILRRLFLELYWSDTDIGNQFGISPFAIRRQRESEGITVNDRIPLEQRLPAELFSKLYLEEGLSLHQIGIAFRIGQPSLRDLKRSYVAAGHTEFDRIRVPGVSQERFNYLKNQIALGLYKI